MDGPPSECLSTARKGRLGLMETVQPVANIGGTIANFSPDADAGWPAAVGAEVVDDLHVRAEIFG